MTGFTESDNVYAIVKIQMTKSSIVSERKRGRGRDVPSSIRCSLKLGKVEIATGQQAQCTQCDTKRQETYRTFNVLSNSNYGGIVPETK